MFQDKQMIRVIQFAIIIFIILIIVIVFSAIEKHKLTQNSDSNEPTLSLTTDSNIFNVSSVVIFSSANALNNSEMQEDYWDLNLYQYSDLAIYIDNNVSIDDLTQKNTIREMYIDNIEYTSLPKKGTPRLYYKDSNFLGVGVIDVEKLISDRLDFNIVSSNDEEADEPTFYTDCSNPILLSSINEEIVSSFIIRNTNSAVTFDGSLLVDATILLSNIEYTLSFSIHIINNLDEEYICNLSIPIELSDSNDINTIYDGSYQQTLTNLPTSKFYKVEQ